MVELLQLVKDIVLWFETETCQFTGLGPRAQKKLTFDALSHYSDQ